MHDFEGKVAVVTGAASGIGRALAATFAGEGMKVVLADIEPAATEQAAAELRDEGADALAVTTDVSDAASVEALADAALGRFGGVHIVCNNAGVFSAGLCWESSLADYEWVLGVNTWGVVHGLRTFVPIMLEQGGEGHIVNTSSMAGVTSMPYCAVYHMSKHAVVTLSECLYHELALKGASIGVTVLCPEGVATRINESGRNRPSVLAPTAGPSDEARLVAQGLDDTVRDGIAPQAIADRVLSAIRDGRFYILSDEWWRQTCDTRLDDVREGRNPTLSIPDA
jgi:NAD(P)-dependent dehydrogenase (short-subunit alcohol dehydrogenase family)